MGNRTGRKKPRQGRGFFIRGGQGQNRTADTRIFSPLLYQLSYLAKNWLFSLPDAVRTFSPCLPCRYAAPLPGLVYGPAPRAGRESRLLKRPGGATSSAGWGLLRRDWVFDPDFAAGLGCPPARDELRDDFSRSVRTGPAAAGCKLPGGARLHDAAGSAAFRRGLHGPVHAGRQPHQVAPGAYLLVLRTLPAARVPARLPGIRRALRLSLQFLLLPGRPDAPPPGARLPEPPGAGGGDGLPRARGRAHAAPALRGGRRGPPPHGAGPEPRTAAPGADSHRHQARLFLQPPEAGLPGTGRYCCRVAAAVAVHRGAGGRAAARPRGR